MPRSLCPKTWVGVAMFISWRQIPQICLPCMWLWAQTAADHPRQAYQASLISAIHI